MLSTQVSNTGPMVLLFYICEQKHQARVLVCLEQKEHFEAEMFCLFFFFCFSVGGASMLSEKSRL